jgi:hypothetical protein
MKRDALTKGVGLAGLILFVAITIFPTRVVYGEIIPDTPSSSQTDQWSRAIIPPDAVAQEVRAVSPEAAAAHATITEYHGPSTCVACHQTQAEAMHGSVHYQQTGPTPNVPNIAGFAGERGFGDIGFNTYCGTHVSSSRATCAGCHVGNGQYPSPVMTTAQLHNIDCLMCHQDQYKRTPAGPFQTVGVVGADGLPATINVPVEDQNGFFYQPDEANMSISIVQAAQTVHQTTRASCLRCHALASGSDGGKRGDISTVNVAPPSSSDIHMSPQGEDFTCAHCHSAGNHRVRGRGLDLRPNDVPERFSCETCHSDRPHGDYSRRDGTKRDTHATRVACQSCHIPTFAKDISTEMERIWGAPFFSAAACSGQGGWKPEEVRASNVVPTYKWFDGTSEVYVLGQIATQNPDGTYAFGNPLGGVDTSDAKIYPMKEHLSTSARLVSVVADINGDTLVSNDDYAILANCLNGPAAGTTGCTTSDLNADGHVDLADYAIMQECMGGGCGVPGEFVPQSTFTYFTTGDFNQAVEAGMAYAGMHGAWEEVPVHTYQTINHGVEDEDNALACGACHASLSGGPVRMDLQGALGYELKGPQSVVCFQCHGSEESKPFKSIHDKHVKDEQFDCSWCHNFSRPDRALTMP